MQVNWLPEAFSRIDWLKISDLSALNRDLFWIYWCSHAECKNTSKEANCQRRIFHQLKECRVLHLAWCSDSCTNRSGDPRASKSKRHSSSFLVSWLRHTDLLKQGFFVTKLHQTYITNLPKIFGRSDFSQVEFAQISETTSSIYRIAWCGAGSCTKAIRGPLFFSKAKEIAVDKCDCCTIIGIDLGYCREASEW